MSARICVVLAFAMLLLSTFGALRASAQGYPPHGPDDQRHQRPYISSVSVLDNNGHIRVGETVRLVVIGTPRARVQADVSEVRNDLALQEVSPGRYEGSLFVDRRFRGDRVRVTAFLWSHGRKVEQTTSFLVHSGRGNGHAGNHPPQYPQPGTYPQGGVPNYGGEVFVTIASPAAGQAVGRDFEIVGTTMPYATVQVTAVLQNAVAGVINVNGQRATATGNADASGRYVVPIHLTNWNGPLGSGNQVRLHVQATNPQTQVSRFAEVTVAARH